MRSLALLGLALCLAGPLVAQERTRSPHGELKLECTSCHRSEGWTQVKISRSFDHSKLGFPLAGAHITAACRSCHQTLDFKGTRATCSSCHQDQHRGELGTDCGQCHTPRSFLDRATMARAHQLTRFPLEGAHQSVDCTACHAPTGQGGLQFVAKSTECVSCHRPNYLAARTPDHVQGGFPEDCSQCHSSTIWGRGRFNHDGTAFPLSGAHRATGCMQCHTGGKYKGTPTQCVVCHQTDYNATAAPKHTTVGFGTDCVNCHSTGSWTTPYDHSRTQFPLTGAHKAATCAQCHADGVYAGKPTTCVSCHQTDFNNAKTPDHIQSGFPTDCAGCHSTLDWTGASFDHNTTQFPLTGAHKATTCLQCHADGVYSGKPTTCVSCHQTDYNNTVAPAKHTLPSFVTTCTNCHTTTVWQPSTFSHSSTAFPLTGMHVTAACDKCHLNAVYKGTATTCQACHLSDYTTATSPNHVQLGWPQTCTTCHTGSSATQAWDVGVTLPTQYHTMFSVRHEHANGVCTQCHNNSADYKQSTCSNHHHPPSCTFLNQGSCD